MWYKYSLIKNSNHSKMLLSGCWNLPVVSTLSTPSFPQGFFHLGSAEVRPWKLPEKHTALFREALFCLKCPDGETQNDGAESCEANRRGIKWRSRSGAARSTATGVPVPTGSESVPTSAVSQIHFHVHDWGRKRNVHVRTRCNCPASQQMCF